MSNRTYNFNTPLTPGTVAKSSEVNSLLEAVDTGVGRIEKELNRALKLPTADEGSEHNFAESVSARAKKIVFFDASGNPIASSTLQENLSAGGFRITNLPDAVGLGEPVTLGQLNAYSGALAGLPSLSGAAGKYLYTDGATTYWETIPSIPAQSGATASKFLMSDGLSASWQAVPDTIPASTQHGEALSFGTTGYGFFREGANLIFNSCGAVNYGSTVVGWSGPCTPSLGGLGWRMIFTPTAYTGWQYSDPVSYAAGLPLSVSADLDTSLVTAGTVSLYVEFLNSSDAQLSATSLPISVNSGLQRYGITATGPAGTAKFRAGVSFSAVTASSDIIITRVKAERGSQPTPFNDAATIAWIAGFRSTTEFGRGFASPVVSIGDATATSSAWRGRSAAGNQTYDWQMTATGGWGSDVSGGADLVWVSRSFRSTGGIGYTTEYDNGNSGTAKTVSLDVYARQKLTLNGNCAITLTAPRCVSNIRIKLVQDGTGGRTTSWAGVPIQWAGGEAPAAQAANVVTFVDFYYDGATLWGSWTPWS